MEMDVPPEENDNKREEMYEVDTDSFVRQIWKKMIDV